MIRFSATLVVIAIGVLIAGVTVSKLTLIYISIAISALALVALAIGVVLKREELFGAGQLLAPAHAGTSTEPSVPGQPLSVDDGADHSGADHSGNDSVPASGPTAPPAQPFLWPAVAPTAQDRISQPAPGQSPPGRLPYGRPAFGQNPARNPWPASNATVGWPAAEPGAPSAGGPVRSPWDDASASGQSAEWDRQAGPVSGWQAGANDSSPAAPRDGAARGNAGRPPLPGRHARNGGADSPRSSLRPVESGQKAESSSPPPFPSAPRRVPGAYLGSSWFDQHGGAGRQAGLANGAGEDPAGGEPATLDSTALDSTTIDSTTIDSTTIDSTTIDSTTIDGSIIDRTVSDSGAGEDTDTATPGLTNGDPPQAAPLRAAPLPGTSSGGGWPGSGWSWSSPNSSEAGNTPVNDAVTTDVEATRNGEPATGGEPSEADPPAPAPATTPLTGADADADADTETGAETGAGTEAPRSATASPGMPAVPSQPSAADEHEETDDLVKPDTPSETTDALHGAGCDAGDGPSTQSAGGARLVTVVPGVPRYHEPNCILIRFMPEGDVQNLTLPEAKKLGTPCVACQPED